MPRLAGDIPYRLLGGMQPTQGCKRTNALIHNPHSQEHHNASMFFDGVSDASVIFGNVDLGIANEWSHMIWVAPSDLTPVSDQTIYSCGFLAGGVINDNAMEILLEASGALTVQMYTSAGTLFKRRSIASAEDNTTPGVDGFFFGPSLWHQIVVTWDGVTMKVYRNGVPMNSHMTNVTDIGGSQTNTVRSITAGNKYAPFTSQKMAGLIHSHAYWSNALTDAEIASIFNSGRGGEKNLLIHDGDYVSSENLLGWWEYGDQPNNTVRVNKVPGGIDIATTQAIDKVTRSAPEGAVMEADGETQFSINFNQGFGESGTVAAWAKCDALPSPGSTQDIIRLRTNTDEHMIAIGITNSGGFARWFFEVSDATNAVINTVLGDTPVVEGDWYHVLGCKNGNFSLRFFVNGVDDVAPVVAGVATTSLVDRLVSFPYDGRLGFAPAGGHNNFVGEIHSVAVWDIAVSENGVRAVFNGGWANLDLTVAHPCYEEAPSLQNWWICSNPGVNHQTIPDVVSGNNLNDAQSTTEHSQRYGVSSNLMGTSCLFDGSGGLATSTALPIGIGNTFTISMWVKPEDVDGVGSDQYPLYIGPNHPSSSNEIQWDIIGVFRARVHASTGTVIQRVAYPGMLIENEWQNLTMVFSGGAISMYHNGVFVPGVIEANVGGSIVDGSRFIDIGGSEHALIPPFASAFDGQIGHVTIWDSTLDAESIRTLVSRRHAFDPRYNNQAYTEAENLVHWWKLGEDTFLLGRDWADTLRSTSVSQLTVENGTITSVIESPEALQLVPGELRSVQLDGATQQFFNSTDNLIGIANAWTVSLWAKSNVTFPVGGAPRILEINDGLLFETNKIEIFMLSSGAMGLLVKDQGSIADLWNAQYAYVFTDQEWNHVAVRWDGTDFEVYINGYIQHPSTIITDNRPDTMSDEARKVSYGATIDSTDHWEGLLGHLAIWNSALNRANIQEIFAGSHEIDLTSNFGNYIQSADLRHYWRPGFADEGFLDEAPAASPAIDLVNSVDISESDIVVNAPPEAVQGRDRSVLLGGSDYYLQSTDQTYQFANNFSIAFWARHNGTFPSFSQILFDIGPSGSFDSGIFIGMDGLGQISFSSGKTAGGGILWAGVWNSVFNNQDWKHLMFTWDGSDWTLYRNGAYYPVSSTSFDGRPGTMADDARILGYGSARSGALTKWNGSLGHLGIWNSVLTNFEALEMYNGGHALDWRFNEGNYVSSANLQHYWRPGWNLGENVGGGAGSGTSDDATVAYTGSTRRDFINSVGIDDSNVVEDAPDY